MRRNRRIRSLLRSQNKIAIGILLFCGLMGGWLLQSENNVFTPEGFQHIVDRLGLLAPLLYIGLLALSVVISPIPSAPLAMVAGAMWGAVPAAIYSVMGGFLGGIIAYFLGRTLGRSAVKTITGKSIYFSKRKGEVYLGWIIFLTRLLPILSFDLISYGAGITKLSFSIYTLATLFGMIPSTFLLTYTGATFTMNPWVAGGATIAFLVALVALPWGIQRYNWFGLRDVIRIV